MRNIMFTVLWLVLHWRCDSKISHGCLAERQGSQLCPDYFSQRDTPWRSASRRNALVNFMRRSYRSSAVVAETATKLLNPGFRLYVHARRALPLTHRFSRATKPAKWLASMALSLFSSRYLFRPSKHWSIFLAGQMIEKSLPRGANRH